MANPAELKVFAESNRNWNPIQIETSQKTSASGVGETCNQVFVLKNIMTFFSLHFILPHHIWVLLDIKRDREKLRGKFCAVMWSKRLLWDLGFFQVSVWASVLWYFARVRTRSKYWVFQKKIILHFRRF